MIWFTTSIAAYASVQNQINEFLDRIVQNDSIRVNIGVIKFALDINLATTELITLDHENITRIKGLFNRSLQAGSNMYGAIIAGEKLLQTGTAKASNKFLVLASDFGGYKSDTGDGKGLSFFYKYSYGVQGVEALHNNNDFDVKYSSIRDVDSAKNYFTVDKVDALISSKVLFNGIAVSDETDKYLTKTGVEASEFPDAWRNPLGHLGIFSHNWTEKEKALLIPLQPFVRRQGFPSAFEKNIYMSGSALKGLKNLGYNVLAVTSPYQPENGEAYKRKFNAASNAFKNWFSINVGPRYEITNDETFVDMLDDIEAKITTIVAKGEIVDEVNSKFKVVPGHEVVLLNGISLQKEVLPSGAIGFGLPEDGLRSS